MDASLKATVVIATRDRPALLSKCLEAILVQESTGRFEVIVVNDGGASLHLDQQLADPRVRVVATSGGGPALARNRGITEARAEIIAFTDDDTIPSQGWLHAAVDALEADPSAGERTEVHAAVAEQDGGAAVANEAAGC